MKLSALLIILSFICAQVALAQEEILANLPIQKFSLDKLMNAEYKNNRYFLMDSIAYQSYKKENFRIGNMLNSVIKEDSVLSRKATLDFSMYEKSQKDPFGVGTSEIKKGEHNAMLLASLYTNQSVRKGNQQLLGAYIDILAKNIETFSNNNANSFMVDKPFIIIETNDASKSMKSIRGILENCGFTIEHIKPNVFEGTSTLNSSEIEKIIVWFERDFDNPMLKLKIFFKSVFLVKPLFSPGFVDSSTIKSITAQQPAVQKLSSSCVKQGLLKLDK